MLELPRLRLQDMMSDGDKLDQIDEGWKCVASGDGWSLSSNLVEHNR